MLPRSLKSFATMDSGCPRDQVVEAVESPDKKENRGFQVISSKAIDDKFALRVVHEERKGIILVITFYPIKRKKYGL